jgi:ubiquitin carboxyl-terminal hydrolase 36/42
MFFNKGIDQKKSGWRDSLPIPRLDETTFVHRMFGGYLRSQVRCTKCKYNSNTYDPFLDLSLEVSHKKANSISAAFSQFTRKETLDEQNKWKCSGCKRRVCATKQLTVFRPPLSLCIQLKRFSFGGGGYGYHGGGGGFGHFSLKGMGMMRGGSKISKQVEFPATLKLPLSDGRKCEYSLTGVIIHIGGSATSGHYTAFVKKPAPMGKYQWHHMDDSYVTDVSERTVLSQKNAYVLFYCRKEVKLEFPTLPPRPIPNADHAIKAGAARARARSNSFNKGEDVTEKAKHLNRDGDKSRTDKPTLSFKNSKVIPEVLGHTCDSNTKQKTSEEKERNETTAKKNSVTPIPISPMFDEALGSSVSSINSKASVKSSISGETMESLNSLNCKESDSSGSTSDDSSSSDSSSSSDTSNSSSSSSGGEDNKALNSISKKLYPYSKQVSASSIEEQKEQKTVPPKVVSISDNREASNETTPSKSPKKKEVSLNLGSNRGTVKVSRKIKQRKAWKPDTSLNKSGEGSLLGNKIVSKWDDDEDADSLFKQEEKKLREAALKEVKEQEKSKKRKMYLDHWDRALDEGKVSLDFPSRLTHNLKRRSKSHFYLFFVGIKDEEGERKERRPLHTES